MHTVPPTKRPCLLINFHIHKDNMMRMASDSRRRNSLSKDRYLQWNELWTTLIEADGCFLFRRILKFAW